MSAPYCHTPTELPDLRIWLAEQWQPGRAFHDQAAPQLDRRGAGLDGHAPSPGRYARWEHDALRQSTLWWVGPDMVDLLLATAAGIPDDATFAEVTPPHPHGLIVFAKPWRGVDSERPGHTVQVDAVVWGPSMVLGHSCLSASTYRRLAFADGLDRDELAVAINTGAIVHGDRQPIGKWETRDGDRGVQFDGSPAARAFESKVFDDGNAPMPLDRFADGERAYSVTGCSWAPLGRSDWPVYHRIGEEPWPMEPAMLSSFVEDRKVLGALWVLLTQPGIASQTEERLDRQTTRRGERAGIPAPLSKVRVIRLRELPSGNPAADDAEPGERRPHDHRWLVRGFWRWQPVGKGRAERRLTFVRPHIRGPADAPLHVPEKVNAWIR